MPGKAAEVLDQSLIVDYRTGSGAPVGTRMVQSAAAHGYTVDVIGRVFIFNLTLVRNAGYNALTNFAAVTLISVTPLTLVAPSALPSRTGQALIDYAKAN